MSDRFHPPTGLMRGERLAEAGPMVVGYAAGAWDLFHVGHLNVLRHARGHCDHLIAGVVSDEMLELAKGRRPVIPAVERAEIVRHVSFVDEIFIETQPDKLLTWREAPFDVFFKGDDWRGTAKGAELERRFAAVGVSVVYFPYTVHTSSTSLRRVLDILETLPAEGAGGSSTSERDGLGAEPAHG